MNSQKLTVYIIDDEPHCVELAVLTLKVAGINSVCGFTSWGNARAALDAKPCDLLLLDIAMPDISGIDILGIMKKDKPQIPVVMLTAFNDVATAVTCMKLGAADYLVKPVTPDKLTAMIQSVLVYTRFFLDESNDGNGNAVLPPQRVLKTLVELDLWVQSLAWEHSALLEELRELLIEGKYYLNHVCTLEIVSRKLKSNRTTLSGQLNAQMNTSFSTLVNRLRIAFFMGETCRTESIYSVDGLANRAGFSSLSAFYEAFKKCTGMTPSQWIRKYSLSD
jgi:YesN/AraC family two-component response regulator